MTEQQQEASEDAVMTRIGQVIMLQHAGDREEARNRFADLWAEIGEDGDPFHRCALAHYMADTQEDPEDELAWDLRALAAAEKLTDMGVPPGRRLRGRAGPQHTSLAVRGFYPSLHLNLAADYVKLRRPEQARIHLDRARVVCDALAEDAYGDGIRAALDRVEMQLAVYEG
jgi:hypothetical protein